MIKQLAFTRFIAAIAIVFFHYGKSIPLFEEIGLSFLIERGNIAVSYFFVLSGFVMIIAYSKYSQINFKGFMINRFARIYPLYFIALLFVIFLYYNSKANFLDIFLNVTMLQSWSPGKAMTLNFPGWSLSVEMFFYLLFPFLYNEIYQKVKFKFLFTAIISFWFLSQIFFYGLNHMENITNYFYTLNDYHYLPILHFNSFLIGNLAGIHFVHQEKGEDKNYLLVILLLSLFIGFALNYNINLHNGLLAIPFALFIYFLSSSNDLITKILKSKIFIYLGEISFGVYILQYPIFMICTTFRISKYFHLSLTDNSELIFFVKVLILILVSTLSHFFFENPLRKIIRYNT